MTMFRNGIGARHVEFKKARCVHFWPNPNPAVCYLKLKMSATTCASTHNFFSASCKINLCDIFI